VLVRALEMKSMRPMPATGSCWSWGLGRRRRAAFDELQGGRSSELPSVHG